MKKLVACALLGFGLTQVLVGCGDDDDAVTPGTSGTSNGGKAGSPSAGNSSGGKAGSTASGGTAGNGTGGSATPVGGEGGAEMGGTTGDAGAGGDPNAAGNGGVGGDSMGGAAGAAGAGGAPPGPVNTVSDLWLSHFCEARSVEVLACDNSTEWSVCYSTYRPFLSTVGEGVCDGDDDDFTKTLALMGALDALAAACPDPDVDQWRCTLDGAPEPKAQDCRDADTARRVATMACGL